MNQLISLKI